MFEFIVIYNYFIIEFNLFSRASLFVGFNSFSRPVAMSCPNIQLIAEISLAPNGFLHQPTGVLNLFHDG